MTGYTYDIFTTPSMLWKKETTDRWQTAIDMFGNLKQEGYHPIIHAKGSDGKEQIINSNDSIRSWSEYLMKSGYNRIEKRIMKEMQEMKEQEENGMKVVEIEETGNFGYRSYLEKEAEEQYQALIAESNYKVAEDCEKKKEIDFHGNFSKMDQSSQDEIINPKHYKMIPKEAYDRFPEGLEYMDLMEYILDSHSGVNSHLLGQIFKYSCRLGKKDADLQDARKIEWYASRLVKSLEHQLIGGEF